MQKTGGAILGIDFLRFAAATMVLLFHLSYWISFPYTTPGRLTADHPFLFPWAAGTTSVGRMGVQMFFVISGFVIAYSANRTTAASFARSRILRLVPAAWICATITLCVAMMADRRSILELSGAWLNSVLFVPFGHYIDGVYWTLGVECSFYLIIFILIAANRIRHMEVVFLAVAGLSAAFCAIILIFKPELRHLIENRGAQLSLASNGCEFSVGVFLWAMLFNGFSIKRLSGLLIGLAGGAMDVYYWLPRPEDRWLGLGIWLVSVLAVVASVRFNEAFRRLLGERGARFARNVGLATYPLYLLHQLVGAATMAAFARLGMPPVLCLLVTMIAMFAAAHVVASVAEPRLRALFRRVFDAIQRKTLKYRPVG